MATLIPASYTASRERFRASLGGIRGRWPAARLEAHAVQPEAEELTIDVLHAPARSAAQHLLLVTTGEHGIEGYVGSAVMGLFMREVLPALDPQTTALCLVHAVNPWGMSHEERTTAANVDLNRNFLLSWNPPPAANAGYRALRSMFQPEGPLRSIALSRLGLQAQAVRLAVAGKSGMLRQALLAGQYEEPRGLYYGGTGWEPETLVMRSIYGACFGAAPHLVHVDLHTGYGPRTLMSVVNSALDPTPSNVWKERIGYPNVVASTTEEFYHIDGDMVDYMYRVQQADFPSTALYATCFEFGCLGDGLAAQIDSLWRAVAANRLRWNGAASEAVAQGARHLWREAYCPSELAWEERAQGDALRAMRGILHDQGLLTA